MVVPPGLMALLFYVLPASQNNTFSFLESVLSGVMFKNGVILV